jgi:F-type H+-transporting ATPase subunit alpha
LSVPEQIAALVAANEGVLDEVPVDAIANSEKRIRRAVMESLPDLSRSIESGEDLSEENIQALADTAQKAVKKDD